MEDVIQVHYELNFFWETWRRTPVMPTYCQPQYPYDSINVNNLRWKDANGSDYTFNYTQVRVDW